MSSPLASFARVVLGGLLLAAASFAQRGASSAQGGATPARIPTRVAGPVHAGTLHLATGVLTPGATPLDGVAELVVFNSNYYTGYFYDIDDGTVVYDEGRLPSPNSPTPMSGLEQTSYRITSLQFAYATDSTVPVRMRLRLWHQYFSCTSPASLPAPVADLTLDNLPATVQPGTFTPFTFDVDLSGSEFCIFADGDGAYSNGSADRFGWSLEVLDGGDGTGTGPILGTRPGTAFAPVLDGTVFQNPNATAGSGLGAEDQWWDVDPVHGSNCFNYGGYNPATNNPPSASFWLVLRSDLTSGCSSCELGADDGFEPNDTCTTAALLPGGGVYAGLVLRDPNEDHYEIVVPAFHVLTVWAQFSHAAGDIDIELYAAGCPGALITTSSGITNTERLTYFNCGATAVTVRLVAFVYGVTASCGDYDLTVDLSGACAVDDVLEDNDTCGAAAPLPVGLTAGLRIRPCDEDYYRLAAAPGESFVVTASFTDALADLDLYLYEDLGGSCGALVASSTSMTDGEQIARLNDTGQPLAYILFVDWVPFGATAFCSTYDLDYADTPATPVGAQFCGAQLNSTGRGAHVFATGSDEVASNDLTLRCRFLPQQSFGLFVNSRTNGFVSHPGGSLGDLCVGGAQIGRWAAPSQIQNSGAGDSVALTIDLSALPRPTSFEAVAAGETWYFQYWFRDIVAMTPVSNFSDGLAVLFR